MPESIERAVILTQKSRPRFQTGAGDLPIAARPVCSVPLIKRQLDGLFRSGIKSCVVVLGADGEQIRQTVEQEPKPQMQIDWVDFHDWPSGEGNALLRTQERMDQAFLLLTSDHLFQVQVIQRLLKQGLNGDDVTMAIDHRVNEVIDKRLANKVKIGNAKVQGIGEKLTEYDAVDVGLYLCKPEIFGALGRSAKAGKSHLNDAMKLLAETGKLRYFDLQDGWWFDLDTPGDIERAEHTLIDSLRKTTDGFVSRHLNRPLSLRLSRLLVNTPVTGNHITYFSLVLGLVAAGFFAVGTYGSVLIGAILFQILSILDGCDGELAKLKLQDTPKGQVLDTVIDHITYLAFLAGVTIGYYRQEQALYVLVIGAVTVLNAALGVSVISQFAKRIGNWSFVVANQTLYPKPDKNEAAKPDLVSRVFSFLKFAIRRDFFAFVTLVVAILGGLAVLFWTAFMATLLYAFGVLYGKRRYLGIS